MRRSRQNPHPETIVDSVSRLRSLPGWKKYTWPQKKFLVLLPLAGMQIRAAEMIGRDQNFCDKARLKHGEKWTVAMALRRAQPADALEDFTEELWSLAVVKLEKRLESSDEMVVLKAVELLAKLQGKLPHRKARTGKGVSHVEPEGVPFEFQTDLKPSKSEVTGNGTAEEPVPE